MLKLIVQHSPQLLAFLCGLHLRLSKPQWQHVLRLTDALVVSEARHKTIASLYRLMVEAPDPSNGADTLRISPWTAEDLRAPIRHFIVADLVAYAHQSDHWMKRTPSSRQKRAKIKIDCYTYEPKYTAAGV